MKKIFSNFEQHKTVVPGLTSRETKPHRNIPQDSRMVVGKDGTKRYYNSFGKLHRLDGPAVISLDGNQLYYQNGKLHREDGPAAIFFNGTQKWFIDSEELSYVEVLQLLLSKGIISVHDIETLKDLAEIAFFDYARTDIHALKQAGKILAEKNIIVSKNVSVISEFLKAALRL